MFVLGNLKKYKGFIGTTKESIDAIQRFIEKNNNEVNAVVEEEPAASVNRILKSVECEETNSEIQKIIDKL